MKFKIEVDEKTVRTALREYLEEKYGVKIPDAELVIEVKSKQNYRSEWEPAAFRASFEKIQT